MYIWAGSGVSLWFQFSFPWWLIISSIFHCATWPLIYLHLWSIQIFCPFFYCVDSFYWIDRVFYTLWIHSFVDTCIVNIVSQHVACFFILLVVIFTKQNSFLYFYYVVIFFGLFFLLVRSWIHECCEIKIVICNNLYYKILNVWKIILWHWKRWSIIMTACITFL